MVEEVVSSLVNRLNPISFWINEEGEIIGVGSKVDLLDPSITVGNSMYDFLKFADGTAIHQRKRVRNNYTTACHVISNQAEWQCSVVDLIEQGLTVFCFKPITLSMDEMLELVKNCDNTESSSIMEQLIKNEQQLIKNEENLNRLVAEVERKDLEILSLSRFPDLNPNPVVRVKLDTGEISYANSVARSSFLSKIVNAENKIDNSKINIEKLINSKKGYYITDKINSHLCYSNKLKSESFLNIYAFDITYFEKKIKDKSQNIDEVSSEISNLNEHLYHEVDRLTEETIKFNEVLLQHEKMATLGQVTAGIAHDLNTPLGAIKASVDVIRYTIDQIIWNDISRCTNEEIKTCYDRAQEANVEKLIPTGMEFRKRLSNTMEMLQQMETNYDDKQLQRIAYLIIKSGIKESEQDWIRALIKTGNAENVLNFLKNIISVNSSVKTVFQAVDQSILTIKNLKEYIYRDSEEEKMVVNLYDSITTVVEIFKHELKYGVVLDIDVPRELKVLGWQNKLFQIWANLIKNAIQAMDKSGNMWILAEPVDGHVFIKFINDGPQVEPEIAETIFEPFFSTKGRGTGTGMGLSIVQRCVRDHLGNIFLESSKELTTFTVKLPA